MALQTTLTFSFPHEHFRHLARLPHEIPCTGWDEAGWRHRVTRHGPPPHGWEDARILSESLAKRSPENVEWWILWAYSPRREKSIPDARAVLLEATKHHPNEALIPYNLACYSCVEGDLLGAKGLLTLAFSMREDLRETALDDPDLNGIFGAEK